MLQNPHYLSQQTTFITTYFSHTVPYDLLVFESLDNLTTLLAKTKPLHHSIDCTPPSPLSTRSNRGTEIDGHAGMLQGSRTQQQ